MERYVLVFCGLFVITVIYVMILNQPAVREWYIPKRTWLTVVIGNALIGLCILAFCLLGDLPIRAFWLLLIANITAGIPVICWQLTQNAQRQKISQANHKD